MNPHEHYRELISRLLDEDTALTGEEQAALRAHLAECAECAAVYEAFAALSDAIGGDLAEPPTRLRENVMGEIRREEIRRKNRRSFRWTGLVAVAAALALLIGVAPRLRGRNAGAQLASYAADSTFAKEAADSAPAEKAAAPSSAESVKALEAPAADAGAAGESFVVENSAAAVAAESSSDYAMAVDAEESDEAPAPSMAALLAFLDGRDCAVQLEAEAPDYMIETDEGVLALTLAGGKLYYADPSSGALREAGVGEAELLRFLQNQGE